MTSTLILIVCDVTPEADAIAQALSRAGPVGFVFARSITDGVTHVEVMQPDLAIADLPGESYRDHGRANYVSQATAACS